MSKVLYRVEGGLTKSELEVIKRAFDLFDPEHTGKVDVREMIDTLYNCGYDQKNPLLFQVMSELDTPEAQKNGGLTFIDLIDKINSKLFDKTSKEALQNLYSIFVDDSQTIKKESLKEICESIGKDYDDEALQDSLDKLNKYGCDLSYEDFEAIILKKK